MSVGIDLTPLRIIQKFVLKLKEKRAKIVEGEEQHGKVKKSHLTNDSFTSTGELQSMGQGCAYKQTYLIVWGQMSMC